VGAGAIVAHDVAPGTMVRGDPARVYATPTEWLTPDGDV
jgi:serine acetyltransferase